MNAKPQPNLKVVKPLADDPGKLAPHSAESEELLLAALMAGFEGDLDLVLMERLEPRHFFIVRHEWIFQAMLDIHEAGLVPSYVTVIDRLKDTGQLEEIGGAVELTRICQPRTGDLIPVRQFARSIRVYAENRALLQFCSEAAQTVVENPQSASKNFARLVEMLGQYRPHEDDHAFVYGAQSIATYDTILTEKLKRQDWLPLPWKVFADRGVILEPGELVVVVGPEGGGKSAFLADIAEYSAHQQQRRTMYIHTEMRQASVLERRQAKYSKVPYERIRVPSKLTDGEIARMVAADVEIADWAARLDYWHAGNIEEAVLFATMLKAVKDFGTEVFVLDYLNDIEPTIQRGQNETSAWRALLKRLEAFAEEHRIFIFTAAQLNAEGGAYQIGRAIKQKASLYLKLNPTRLEHEFGFAYDGIKYLYSAGDFSPLIGVEIEKFRGGARGKVELLYVGPRYTWTDKPRDWGMAEPIDIGGAS